MSDTNPMDEAPSPDAPEWGHAYGHGADGVRIHYVRQGSGPPVLLLHGWPGFWYDWRHVIPLLAGETDVIAPDFRGFGGSDKPDLPPAEGYSPAALARDMWALLDDLGLDRVTIAAHDIGATVAQAMARHTPSRIHALVLLDPPYPGIGARRFEPAVQREFWYQHFHQLPLAEALAGRDRESLTSYLGHFYRHWAGRRELLVPREFEAIVDQYAEPGAFGASIRYYRARAGARAAEAAADPATQRIDTPTTVLWGDADPVMRVEWSDRIPEFFPNSTLTVLPGVGHFVPWEAPAEVAAAVVRHTR
jgi:pimeloyl-ACP methyl ester carboxylesterase